MPTNLTDDEFTVLMIAKEGEALAAIGRWEKPVEALVERGLLSRGDKFNNFITTVGTQAVQEEDARRSYKIFHVAADINSIQHQIRDFAEQAAQLLAQAAKASNRVTGDPPIDAAKKWSDIILRRAVELLE